MDFLKAAMVPVIWSTTYVVTSELLPPGRPLLAAVLRALPAGLILLVIVRQLPKGEWWWKSAVLGLCNFTAFFTFLFAAAYLLPNGVAAVLTNTSPLVVMAIAPFLLHTHVTRLQVLAGLVAVIGVAALTISGDVELSPVGLAAGFGASLAMGTGMVLAKKFGRPEGVPQLAVTAWQLTFGGIFLLPLLVFEGLPDHLSGKNLAGYAYLCIVGALIAYMIWFQALARLDAVRVSLLSPISPLVATAIGVLYVGERLTTIQWLGAALVLASLVATQLIPALGHQRTQRTQRQASTS